MRYGKGRDAMITLDFRFRMRAHLRRLDEMLSELYRMPCDEPIACKNCAKQGRVASERCPPCRVIAYLEAASRTVREILKQ
jgi:hypothetical protein